MLSTKQDKVDVIQVDLKAGRVRGWSEGGNSVDWSLATPEGFSLVSSAWLRASWDTKYVYSFTWLGRPIIQLPEDLLRLQEVIYRVQPDVIVETGVAHGGSLIYYASLCSLIGKGRVLGIDIEIRAHNRAAIEAHPLRDRIHLIVGDSTAPATVSLVKDQIAHGETVLILLDSCHTKSHVLAELEAYGPLVASGSYIVAMDGIMQEVAGAPRTQPDWTWNNPQQAVRQFLDSHAEFILEEPTFAFNEGAVSERVTYWPACYLRRT